LVIRRDVLGNRHPETLNSINNLANLRRAQGHLDQAELLYVEALEVRRHVLGNQHPDTLWSIGNLASLRKEQGRLDVAEELYVEALEGFRQRLGNQHRDTLLLMYNLANLRMVQGASAMDQGAIAVRKLAEAEALYIEALYTQRAILGQQHSETLDTTTNLAKLRLLQGRLGEAEEMYMEILASLGPAIDEQHPRALQVSEGGGPWNVTAPDVRLDWADLQDAAPTMSLKLFVVFQYSFLCH
jgi:tetratricopeptide (TPR) repeat protein